MCVWGGVLLFVWNFCLCLFLGLYEFGIFDDICVCVCGVVVYVVVECFWVNMGCGECKCWIFLRRDIYDLCC